MRYTLYTTVDITRTRQHRYEPDKAQAYQQEQNFQSVLQTLGIRANITISKDPEMITTQGTSLGFESNKIIRIWVFEFETEQDLLYQVNDDPVGYLIQDFDGIPYISGLEESMEQNYDVFVTEGPARNIVFRQE